MSKGLAGYGQWLSRHGLSVGSVLVLAGLVGIIAWETDGGRRWVAAVPASKAPNFDSAKMAILPSFSLPPVDTGFAELTARPLFIPTRLPVPAATGAAVSMRKGQYKLTGTSINSGLTIAYLVEISSGKSIRAPMGTTLSSGIQVDQVQPTRVVLKQGEDSEELVLRTSTSPPVAATQAALQTQASASGQAASGQSTAVPGLSSAQSLPPGVSLPSVPAGFSGVLPPVPVGGGFSAPPTVSGAPVVPNAFPLPNFSTGRLPSGEPNTPAERRRRFQNLPQ